MAYLNYRGNRLELNEKLTTIGSGLCDIQIQGPGVELQHSIIEFDPQTNEFWLKDLNTKFGTSVNGMILRDASTPIAPGDKIKFGTADDSLMFCLVENPLPIRKLPSSIRIVSASGNRAHHDNYFTTNAKSIWWKSDKTKPPSPALSRFRHRVISGGSAIDKSFVQYEGGSSFVQQHDVMSVSSADSIDVRNRYGEKSHRKNVRFPQSHVITHLQQKIQKLEETVRHYDKRLKSYQSEDEEMMAARPNYQRKNSIAESYEKAELLEQISQLQNRLTEKTIEVEQMSGKLNNLQSELQEKSQTIIEMVHRSNSQNTKRLTNGIEERLGKSHFRSSNSLGSDSSIVSLARSHSPNVFSSAEQLHDKSMSLPHLFEPIGHSHKPNAKYSLDDLLENSERYKQLLTDKSNLETENHKLLEELNAVRLKHKLAETVKRAIIADACDTIDKMSNDQADWTNTSVDTAAKMKLYEEKVKSLLENEHHKDGNLEQKLLEELKEWESLISKAALTKPILVDHKNKVDRLNSMETRITNQLHHINQWATGLNVELSKGGLRSSLLQSFAQTLSSDEIKSEHFDSLCSSLSQMVGLLNENVKEIEQKLNISDVGSINAALHEWMEKSDDQTALTDNLRSQIAELLKQLEEVIEENKNSTKELEILRKEKQFLLERAEKAELNHKNLMKTHQTLSEASQAELENLKEGKKQLDQIESERNELLIKLKSAETQLEADSLEIGRLQQLGEEWEKKIRQLEDERSARIESKIDNLTKEDLATTQKESSTMATSSSSSCNCAGLHTSFSSRDLSVVKLEEDKNHLEQEVFNLQERILELEHMVENQKKGENSDDSDIRVIRELQQKLNEQESKFDSVHKELRETKEELNTYRSQLSTRDQADSTGHPDSEYLELSHKLATLLELEKQPVEPSETVLTADKIAESVEQLLRRIQSQNEELKTYRSGRLDSSHDGSKFDLKDIGNLNDSDGQMTTSVSIQMAKKPSKSSSSSLSSTKSKASPKPKKKDLPLKVVTFELPH